MDAMLTVAPVRDMDLTMWSLQRRLQLVVAKAHGKTLTTEISLHNFSKYQVKLDK